MDDKQYAEIAKYFEKKQIECMIQKIAYDKWLSVITPMRWTFIALGVILPAFLGISIFTDSGVVTTENWKLICGVVLMLSSIVSGLHTAFKFDSHHQECIRLSKQYESLANKFELAQTYDRSETVLHRKVLSDNLSELLENTLTTPAQWCVKKATRQYIQTIR